MPVHVRQGKVQGLSKINFIIAEGLAQRNPQLKALIANLHKQFCSRLNSANVCGRPLPGTPTNRTMRRILEDEPVGADPVIANDNDKEEDDSGLIGYQQNSLRAAVTVADETPALPLRKRSSSMLLRTPSCFVA